MLFKFSNAATATITGSITSTATSVAVTSGFGALFPSLAAGEVFTGVLVDASNNLEIVRVTARAGDVMTIVRAQEGTVARAFSSGSRFEMRLTVGALNNFMQLDGAQTVTGQKTFTQTIIGNLQGNVTGNAGTVTNGVYTTGDQTIAGNKTFTGSTGNSMMYAYGTAGLGLSVSANAIFTGGYSGSTSGRLFIGDGTGWVYNFSRRVGGVNTDVFSFSDTGNFSNAGSITAAGDITAFSDERLKTNWRDLPADFVERLAAVKHGVYDRVDTGDTQVGVGAASLKEFLSQAV